MTDTRAPQQVSRAALFGSAVLGPRTPQPIPRKPAANDPHPQDGAAAARAAANRAELSSGSNVQVEQQVIAILAASQQRTIADLMSGDQAADGSLALDSMSAVFVCSIVSSVLGPRGWTRLRGNCAPEDFVSTRSLAGLVCRLRKAVAVA